ERQARGRLEARGGARAVGGAGGTGETGDRRHCAGGRDFSQQIIVRVGDEQITGAIERETLRRVEASRGAGAVARAGRTRAAGKRRDRAARSDLADGMVAGVADPEITRAIDDDTVRI